MTMRPEYSRFYPSTWREHTIELSLEAEGLLIRISAYNMSVGKPLPANRTRASALIFVQRQKLDKVLRELISAGAIMDDETGIYSPRAIAEFERASGSITKTKRRQDRDETSEAPSQDLEATSEAPQGDLKATSGPPPSGHEQNHEQFQSSDPIKREDREEIEVKRGSARARSNPDYWTAELNPSATGHGSVALEPNGSIRLMNGTRQKWVAQFGSVERLNLALAQAAAYIEPNSSKPLLVRVEAQLARQLADRDDRDRRYHAAKKSEPSAKPKRTMRDVLMERANAAI